MKMRYFASVGIIIVFSVCFLVDRNVVSGDTFNTGASTNVVPGSMNVTGALTVQGNPVSTNSVVTTNFVQKTGDTMTGGLTNNVHYALTNDVFLERDSANALALRNGGNKQFFRTYGFYTDSSNYKYVGLDTDLVGTGFLAVSAVGAGTGANPELFVGTAGAVSLRFFTANSSRWKIDGTGNFLAELDNTFDIGASGASRPRRIHIGGTTNEVVFGSTNAAPVDAVNIATWISVQVAGDTNAYRLPLYK